MPTDHDRIHDLYADLMRAWNANDADAYGACFTEDCDYVSYDGTRATGRRPMVDNHDRLFRGVLAGSALVGACESIRLVTADVAMVHGTASVLMPWRTELPKRRLSRQTLVAVRVGESWRFTALHNGRIRPMSIPAPDALPSRMSRMMTRAARAFGLGSRGTLAPER